MKYTIRQQSGGTSAAKHRRPRAGQRHGFGRLVGSLSITYALLVSLIIAPGARAQTGQPQPGLNDPVGNYTFFPSHDMVAFAPGANLSVQGYRADQNLNLSGAFSYSQPADADQIVAASGHIWRPQDEQVVSARRGNGNDLAVTFVADPPTSGPSYVINDFQSRLPNGSSDFMSIAAGDLDKVPDSNGDNHDEVVVAYATSDGDIGGFAKVAVLDYTQPATAPPSPVAVTTVYASQAIAFSYFPNGYLPSSPSAWS